MPRPSCLPVMFAEYLPFTNCYKACACVRVRACVHACVHVCVCDLVVAQPECVGSETAQCCLSGPFQLEVHCSRVSQPSSSWQGKQGRERVRTIIMENALSRQ